MVEPIEPRYRVLMEELSITIDQLFNPKGEEKTTGFILLVGSLDSNNPHKTNYISNVQRPDALAMMQELIGRLEGRRPDAEGHA